MISRLPKLRVTALLPFAFGILIGISITLFYHVNSTYFPHDYTQLSRTSVSHPKKNSVIVTTDRIRKHRPAIESHKAHHSTVPILPKPFSATTSNKTKHENRPHSITSHLLSDGVQTAAEEWAPIVYDYCDERWMPSKYAPCTKEAKRNPHLLKKEELVYPDFKLSIPNFINKEYEKFWVEKIKKQTDRIRWRADGGIYAGQHGQNLVFGKGEYSNLPRSSWTGNTCMGGGVRHTFKHRNLKSTDGVKDTIIVSTSPDSGYFQHFLDRVTHVVTQGESHYDKGAGLMLGAYSVPKHIHKLIRLLGLVHDSSSPHSVKVAKSLVFSCRAPLIHPYLSLRLREKLNVLTDIPLAQRKTVLYVTRKHSRNGGRRVVNENDMLDQVRKLLEQRQQNEELVVFDESNFESFSSMVEWFGKNVLAIFGPHGGSWYNQRWAGKDTLLIEFVPRNRHEIMFWEEAQILSQNYWPMTLESLNGVHDMNVPIHEVLEILETNLGKPNPSGKTIQKHYNWDVPQ